MTIHPQAILYAFYEFDGKERCPKNREVTGGEDSRGLPLTLFIEITFTVFSDPHNISHSAFYGHTEEPRQQV